MPISNFVWKSRSQKKLIKYAYHIYKNVPQWNLGTKYLEPLKEFMDKNIR
jgi:hypothetical protein